jgi:hypothetical protein
MRTSPFSLPLIFVLKPGSGATNKKLNGILGVKPRILEVHDSEPQVPYRRQPFLGSARRRDLFLSTLEETRQKYDFVA